MQLPLDSYSVAILQLWKSFIFYQIYDIENLTTSKKSLSQEILFKEHIRGIPPARDVILTVSMLKILLVEDNLEININYWNIIV